jgi:ATP-dependent DNA helicase RecG
MSSSAESNTSRRLDTPVQYLKGVGPQRAPVLSRLELHTVMDVLFCFPRDYQDMSCLRTVDQFAEGELLSVCGTVDEVDLQNTGPGRSLLGALINADGQYLRAVWFNQPFMRDRLPQGRTVVLSGKARLSGGRWEMAHPRVELVSEEDSPPAAGRILPVYPLTDGLNQGQMRRITTAVVDECTALVEEVFPGEFLEKYDLMPIHEALPQIHFPSNDELLQRAKFRFIYQELLVLQLALALRRQHLTTDLRAPALVATAKIDSRIERLFPFDLTAGQRAAIGEIAADMGRETPMNRLLQGDVGSGKTAVAVYAMLLAVVHGRQAALMSPTEVLARQHYRTLSELLRDGNVRCALMTGTLTAAQRKQALEEVAAGEVDLVIGTQAMASEQLEFADLGLVVIDEQHKFGVRQRATLRGAGLDPHYLVMTATPIPRTVAMTLFGDLDVSTLRDSPPGRQQVRTYVAADEQRDQWWEFFCRKLREGRQGYVVAPRVEAADNASSLDESFESLANGPLEAFRLGYIHGRMNPKEKDEAMESFRRGETQVLVATSVVEVGVDVPNATVMTIESGERFGLAQLHQLRGRVRRGGFPGFVCVFAQPTSDESRERLNAFAASTDGFELAEIDFRLRGPGDLFGIRQHGLPPLRIADLQRDAEILDRARQDARTIVAEDAGLEDERFARLRRMVLVRYGQALEISDVG